MFDAPMAEFRMSRSSQIIALILFVGVTFLAAGVGGFATTSSVSTWFPTLHKPSWNPPAWVFGPVWTILYAAMALAAWLVWKQRERRAKVRPALAIYFGQLALNAVWSFLFFGLRRPDLALVNLFI